MAPNKNKTDSVRVSLNSGTSWQEIKIFEEELLITKIDTDMYKIILFMIKKTKHSQKLDIHYLLR